MLSLAVQAHIAKMPTYRTMGESMKAFCSATTKEEAAALKAAYIDSIRHIQGEQSEEVANQNIGYMTGYYDRAEAARLLELYDASHPVFGRSHADGTLTSEQAFELGKKMGEQSKRTTPPTVEVDNG